MPNQGGDGTSKFISLMNDTGSDVMTVLDTDFLELGHLSGWSGGIGYGARTTADGSTSYQMTVQMRVQLVKNDGTPMGPWFKENAIIRPGHLDVTRLSGVGMRTMFYFGTGPTFESLSIAQTKGGMQSLLICLCENRQKMWVTIAMAGERAKFQLQM